jgi:hypothetical protein
LREALGDRKIYELSVNESISAQNKEKQTMIFCTTEHPCAILGA